MRNLSLAALLLGVLCFTVSPLACHAQGPNPHGPGGFGGQHGPGAPGGPGGPGGRHGHGIDRLTKELNLTPGQVARIKPIMDGDHDKFKAIFTDPKLSQQQKFAKLQQIHAGEQAQIAHFLTPGQAATLKADDAKRPHWGGPGGPGGHGGFGGPGGQRGPGGPQHA